MTCACPGWQTEGGSRARGGTEIVYCGTCDHHVSWHADASDDGARSPQPFTPFLGQGHRIGASLDVTRSGLEDMD